MISSPLMPHRKGVTLFRAGDFTFGVRCIDFSLACQPVCNMITAFEGTVFGMKIGGIGDLTVVLCCLAIDGSLFMRCFCSVYGL
jgi:hypothetical protein